MMYYLNKNSLINTGTNRACYSHPKDINKCIKINITKNNKETIREVSYYKRLKENNTSFKYISEYYGSVDTSRGKGEVFELIRDYDGNISKELDKCINDFISEEEIKFIIRKLKKLKKYLTDEKIYVKDLNSVNILFQKLNKRERRLVIIDGLSHKNYNPFFYNLNYFKNKKINKCWIDFINGLIKKQLNKKLQKALYELR